MPGRDDLSNLRRAAESRGAEPCNRRRWHDRTHARLGGNWVERAMNASVAQQKSLTRAPDGLDLLWETVGRIKVGMLTSAGADGLLVGRPMTTVEIDRSGWLGFPVASDGALAQDVRRDPRVNLTYSDSDEGVYVSITGRAQIVHGDAIAKALWSPAFARWLPGGIDDPQLGSLRVTVARAECWTSSSKLVQWLTVAKAALMQTPSREIGEHHTFEF
jgi:general stress protein 26